MIHNEICLHHSGLDARLTGRETDDVNQWRAIDGIRADIKSLLLKIGIIVGGMQAISTIAIAIIIHYATK